MLSRAGCWPVPSNFLEGKAARCVQGLKVLGLAYLPSVDKASVPVSHGPPNSQGNRRR